jgi:hypothetical protein
VVSVITRGHLAEPFTNERNRLMTAALQLRFDFLELGDHPFLCRLTPETECPIFATDSTKVRESEESKGFRFSLASLLPVESGEPPKLDQPRLFRM